MWCLCVSHLAAEIPVEREQQFTYYFYAAKDALETEQYDRALMLLRMCESIKPDDGQTAEYLGIIYEALGRKTEALDCLRRAYEGEETLWERYAHALMREGSKQSKRTAIRITERAVKATPKDINNLDFLRQVYSATGKYRKALRVRDKMDKIIGYDAYSAIHRYQIYVMAGKPKKAIRAIEHYLEVDPTNIRFLLFRVELLEYTHAKWSVLEKAYQDVLSIDPNHLLTLNNYAYHIATYGGDLREAERMSQRTISAEPNNPVYLDTYAWILHLEGQDTLAAFYIRKALENAGENDIKEIREHYEAIVK